MSRLPWLWSLVSLAALAQGAVSEAASQSPSPSPPPESIDRGAFPRVVREVELRGLAGTQQWVVLRELPWRPGESVSRAAWELGVARLWNTGLFSRVDASLRDDPQLGPQSVAVLTLEERFSLNPLFSFGVGGGAWWFRVGANDINWLGRFLEWGARYERFDAFNGGQAWLRAPRLLGERLGGLLQVDYLFRPRPLYVRRRLSGLAELGGELDDVTWAGVRLEAFRDEYSAPLVGAASVPGNLVAGQLTAQLRLGRVDTVRLRQRGWSLELRNTFGVTAAASGAKPLLYLEPSLELLGFKMLGERWNLALRVQAALPTDAPGELSYFLGGLDQVRGYPDSVAHAQSYALANAELRVTLFDSTWFAVVGAAFVDGALVGPVGPPMLSTGAGVRLLVPKWVKTGVRIDGAVTLVGVPAPGLSLGVYQFF